MKTVLLFAFALVGFVSGSARAADASEEALLDRWLNAQTNLVSWSAEFTQIRRFPTLTQPLETPGRVSFKAPSSFRWQLGEPARTIAVRGPGEALIYYPKLKRAERYALGAEARGPWKDAMALLDAGFPRSRAQLVERFEVEEIAASKGTCRLRLRPRGLRARRLLPKMSLEFDVRTLGLTASEFEFADGSSMRNEYRNLKADPAMADEVFRLELPAEVTVKEPGTR